MNSQETGCRSYSVLPLHDLTASNLLAAHSSSRHLLDHPLAPGALVQVALDPLVAVSALLVSTFAFGESFEGPYLILTLIVFSLTFPGSCPKGTSIRALAGDVLTSWLVREAESG